MSEPAGPYPIVRDADRIRRLVALPGLKPATAERLAQATVAIVGVGGLGSIVAPYLAACGVGRIRLIDPDVVSATDLGRQILYTPADIGQSKVTVLERRLVAQNPAVTVDPVAEALTAENVARLLEGATIVVDGLDTGPPRDVLNRWAVATGVPVVFGGALGYEGQVLVVRGRDGPCLACVFGPVADAPGDCAVAGVLGPLVGIVGSVQAAEVVKLVLGVGTPLIGRLWQWDAYAGVTRILAIPSRPDCPVCGTA
jgi:molybdopterin/thiamine biosynthesis adenylyltransferase